MEKSVQYLIVGAGLTAANASAAIRERDKEGSILIVGQEPHPPYDRPPFSKAFLLDDDQDPDSTHSKPDAFYAENQIQLHTGTRATRLDRAARTVALDNGDIVRYEKLLLATGARPNALNVPGHDLTGVFLLRTMDDSSAIRTALQNSKRAVLVGAGFIGMEVAAACAHRGLEATIVAPEDRPWASFASPELSAFYRGYYEARGVKFLLGDTVNAFEGDGSLKAVLTKSGNRIEADLAVVGIGVTLNTELAKDAGLETETKRGAVKVDSHLQTSDPNIWAAGDIAFFEDVALGKRWHVEHYMNAMWQGEAAGAIMAGEKRPFDQVAYFFSDQFDLSMILRGDPEGGRKTKVVGDLSVGEFVELYHDDSGVIRMGVAVSHEYDKLDPPISDKLELLIRAKANVESVGDDAFVI